MKKILIFALLSLSCILLFSCELIGNGNGIGSTEKECKHKNIQRTEYAASCGEKGYTHYKCPDCELEFDADFASPLEHSFDEKTVEPTCETEGYTEKTCSACGYVEKSDFVAALGHELLEMAFAPDCEKQGFTYAKCQRCDYYTSYGFVASLGHDYEDTLVRPTAESIGYTLHVCKTCQREYKSDFSYYDELFTGAAGEGRGELAWGIDVSYHNTSVDWQKLKDEGIDFVIIRLGSSREKDKKFEEYYAGAKAVGLDVGVYFFTYSLDVEGAKKDAELTLRYLDGKQLEYPVFYDMEDFKDGGYVPSDLPVDTRTEMLYTYVTEMINNGYYPGIYTNLNWIQNKFSEKQICDLFDVWIARYPGANYSSLVDEYSAKYSMWQYTESGTINGIYGNVDLNVAFKDYPTLMKELGLNGY